jgi:hypothetical protein
VAVYTEFSDEEFDAFIKGYDLGAVLSVKGIAEGVENSNFLLATEAPDALRKAGPGGGPAVFSRADGASCRSWAHLPHPGA